MFGYDQYVMFTKPKYVIGVQVPGEDHQDTDRHHQGHLGRAGRERRRRPRGAFFFSAAPATATVYSDDYHIYWVAATAIGTCVVL